MRKRIVISVVVMVSFAGLVWFLFGRPRYREGFDPKQNVFAAETRKILDSGGRFVLLSLDPKLPFLQPDANNPGKEMFHGYFVLGKSEIRDSNERAHLLRALYEGIENSDGSVAACFNPRHGISATLGGDTVELVICFECQSIATYAAHRTGVLTAKSPEKTFNRALEKAGLPIAK